MGVSASKPFSCIDLKYASHAACQPALHHLGLARMSFDN